MRIFGTPAGIRWRLHPRPKARHSRPKPVQVQPRAEWPKPAPQHSPAPRKASLATRAWSFVRRLLG
jgi:hypothetical protein